LPLVISRHWVFLLTVGSSVHQTDSNVGNRQLTRRFTRQVIDLINFVVYNPKKIQPNLSSHQWVTPD
jgi:hypothetical protein